jgi:hypothetical protein
MTTANRLSWALGLLGVCGSAGAAWAQEFQPDTYPQALVERPLVLAPGMMEFTLGASSDFAAAQSADAIGTRLDFTYAFAYRLQTGVETQLQANPDIADAYDLNAFLEYNLMPSFGARASLYVRDTPDAELAETDAALGFRIGVPVKAGISPSAAIVSHPRYGQDLTGSVNLQTLDVPLGIQLQAVSQLAFYAVTGFHLQNWEFDNPTFQIPFRVGALISPTRTFDIGIEFALPDLTGPGVGDVNGFDNRVMLATLALRR